MFNSSAKKLCQGAVRKIQNISAAHVEQIVKKQHVDGADICHSYYHSEDETKAGRLISLPLNACPMPKTNTSGGNLPNWRSWVRTYSMYCWFGHLITQPY